MIRTLALFAAAVLAACSPEGERATDQARSPATPTIRLGFSGGPEGGTFQFFSNGISIRLSKSIAGLEVSNSASAGSLENLRRVNSGDADFGIVYSGDVYLGRQGQLTRDTSTYTDVQVLAFLYGAPAQLVVRAGDGIETVADLAGKRVAVGGAGSGAAGAAQRYFESLGLWEKMKPEFLGYSKAASALGDGLIDAFWILAGPPNASVIQAAATGDVRLLDIAPDGHASGFFDRYPFYVPVTVPAGTYSGIDRDVASFQDSALWVASAALDADTVEAALREIFSPEGLAYMVKVKSTARSMSLSSGLDGVVTAIHPGAERFWRSQGLEITPEHAVR